MDEDLRRFYGFNRPPFGPLAPIQEVFRPGSRSALLIGIVAQIFDRRAVIAVRGQSGVGKTSFARDLAAELRGRNLFVVELRSTCQTPLEVQRVISAALGCHDHDTLQAEPAWEKLCSDQNNATLVVLIDDADKVPCAMFRYFQLLTDLAEYRNIRFHLVFFGSLGQWPGLGQSDLEKLRRACVSYDIIFPFTEVEAQNYINHRFAQAGQTRRSIISRAALREICLQAEYLPAKLDAVTERALVHGYQNGLQRITLKGLRKALPAAGISHPQRRQAISDFFPRRSAFSTAIAMCSLAVIVAAAWFPELSALYRLQALGSVQPEGPHSLGSTLPDVALGFDQTSKMPLGIDRRSDPQVPREAGAHSTPDAPRPNEKPQTKAIEPSDVAGSPGLVFVMQPSDNLASLYAKVYRGLKPPPYSAIVAANPTSNKPGSLVVFPQPPEGWGPVKMVK